MSTYRYPYKCLSCGLHTNVYSWDEAWNRRHRAHCPECGNWPMFLLGIEHLPNAEIYQFVGAVVRTELEEKLEELKQLPT